MELINQFGWFKAGIYDGKETAVLVAELEKLSFFYSN